MAGSDSGCRFRTVGVGFGPRKPARAQLWASAVVKDVAVDAEGLGLNSQDGQIRHTVANGSPPLRRFFGAVLPRR